MVDAAEPAPLPQPPEIKPKTHLVDLLTPKEKNNQNPIDYLVVCGQGPVLDKDTLDKPDSSKKDVEVTPISWMKTIARAAGELKLTGGVKKIVLTGGKTGGEQTKSEAELMKDILVSEYYVPEIDIIVEDTAANTLQNFAFSLNKIDSLTAGQEKSASIGLLGADFHLARIRQLAELFGVKTNQAFSAEQIFNLIADRADDQELKQLIRSRINLNEDLSAGEKIDWQVFQALSSEEKARQQSKSAMMAPTHFEKQLGKEGRGIKERMLDENWFSYGLVDVPKYWIGYLGYLTDNNRLMTILKTINTSSPETLKEVGIDLDQTPETIKQELLLYAKEKRTGPPEFDFARTDWPASARDKLQKIVDNRKSKQSF